MRVYEISSALFFSVLGIAVIVGGLRLGFGQWQNPGQGFMAVLAGIALTFLSGVWTVLTVVKHEKIGPKSFFVSRQSRRHVMLILLSLMLYALILNTFGFLTTTFLFLVFLFRVIKPQTWMRTLITALIVSIVSFILFEMLLKVQFPQGFLNLYRIKYWIF
jgi:putative tricarboxylic transport membrane protein